jgi:hypothetical protein
MQESSGSSSAQIDQSIAPVGLRGRNVSSKSQPLQVEKPPADDR